MRFLRAQWSKITPSQTNVIRINYPLSFSSIYSLIGGALSVYGSEPKWREVVVGQDMNNSYFNTYTLMTYQQCKCYCAIGV